MIVTVVVVAIIVTVFSISPKEFLGRVTRNVARRVRRKRRRNRSGFEHQDKSEMEMIRKM